MHIRTRYKVTFGSKIPGHDWYSDTIDQLMKDYDRLKSQLVLGTYQVTELVDDKEQVVDAVELPITLQ